jgi:hypothetical protein
MGFNAIIPNRFQAVKGRIHSTGAVWLTILNLPRDSRYLYQNTILLMLPPGPHEPSLEQLNECMDPIAIDLNDMYKGSLYDAEISYFSS